MDWIGRLGALIRGAGRQDDMAQAYPAGALDAVARLAPYPPKLFLGERNVHAWRIDAMFTPADAARVIDAIDSLFGLPDRATFQEGCVRRGGKCVHYSLRPEFGGAVAGIVTNSAALLERIDSLALRPPPPWNVFADADPSALGSLQGPIAYWWEQFFLPFWHAASEVERTRYLHDFAADEAWREFIALHAGSVVRHR